MATTTMVESGDTGLPPSNEVEIVEKLFEIGEHQIKLQFVRIYETFLIWIGDPLAPTFDGLSLAMGQTSTSIIEKRSSELPAMDSEMASRLSRKFNQNKPVYVSYNYLPAVQDCQLKLSIDKEVIKFVTERLQTNSSSGQT